MFERYTDRARRVITLAQEEAKLLSHNYIGTEHILLGLIREGEGVAAVALESLGISLESVQQQVKDIVGLGQKQPDNHIPFTPRAKKVLDLSLRESLTLGHNYIGPEHILLGLIREGEGIAAQILLRLGTDLGRVREQTTHLLLHGVPLFVNPVQQMTIDAQHNADGSTVALELTPPDDYVILGGSVAMVGPDGAVKVVAIPTEVSLPDLVKAQAYAIKHPRELKPVVADLLAKAYEIYLQAHPKDDPGDTTVAE